MGKVAAAFSLAQIGGKVASSISLYPWLLLVAAGAVLALSVFSGYVGMRYERSAWQAKVIKEIERARKTERAGVAIMNAAEAAARKADRERLKMSELTIKELRDELAKNPARCPVSRRAVRLLDGTQVPRDPRPPARVEAEAAPVAADGGGGGPVVECGEIIEHCAHNRVNVCDAAADQAEQLQDAYERVRRRYNRAW